MFKESQFYYNLNLLTTSFNMYSPNMVEVGATLSQNSDSKIEVEILTIPHPHGVRNDRKIPMMMVYLVNILKILLVALLN